MEKRVIYISNFLLSAVIYGGLTLYGCWQDKKMMVKYTDVDYWILHDAAKLMLEGKSPYDRSTFRYSPLLGVPLIFNHLLKSELIGKAIFSLMTIIIGHYIMRLLLEKQRLETKKALLFTNLCWTLNPLVLGISTRGSAEAMVMLPVALFAWYITHQRRTLSAIFLGLAIHLKLFPIIYVPSVLTFYGMFPWATSRRRNSANISETTSVLSTPMRTTNNQMLSPLRARIINFKLRHLLYIMTTISIASFGFAISWWFYGEKSIKESFLYHLSRRDHRHNFSPYFPQFHLASGKEYKWWWPLLQFLPQALLMLAVSLRFGRVDLPFACFLQTWLFISFNKVITSQIDGKEWIASGMIWLAGQGIWLHYAYRLEFRGEAVFDQLWFASLVFLVINALLAAFFIYRHKDKQNRILNHKEE